MNDPHVERLHYKLEVEEGTTFSPRAPAVDGNAPGFTVHLENGSLVVEMQEHHASEASARAAVQPFLDLWEIRHALRVGGRKEFRFAFERSELVDRDPPPPGTHQIVAGAASLSAQARLSTSLSVERGSYPEPPSDFVLDADASTLWQRWEGYCAGREPLQAMAYFCMTVLELHGGRPGASARFGVAATVLSTLGRLSTETGDATSARKATAQPRPATSAETAWLEAVVRRLVLRAGQVAADPAAAKARITMADLPKL